MRSRRTRHPYVGNALDPAVVQRLRTFRLIMTRLAPHLPARYLCKRRATSGLACEASPTCASPPDQRILQSGHNGLRVSGKPRCPARRDGHPARVPADPPAKAVRLPGRHAGGAIAGTVTEGVCPIHAPVRQPLPAGLTLPRTFAIVQMYLFARRPCRLSSIHQRFWLFSCGSHGERP